MPSAEKIVAWRQRLQLDVRWDSPAPTPSDTIRHLPFLNVGSFIVNRCFFFKKPFTRVVWTTLLQFDVASLLASSICSWFSRTGGPGADGNRFGAGQHSIVRNLGRDMKRFFFWGMLGMSWSFRANLGLQFQHVSNTLTYFWNVLATNQ